tara:strand:- start:3549 stop:4190 length:642 start_codon:yes stop_codon:yes gene_type:complete
MQIKIKDNIKQFSKGLSKFEKKQIPFATAQAINATLGIGKGKKDKGLDREFAKQMVKKLDRPRPQTTKAFFRKAAKKTHLVGELGLQSWAAKFLKYQIDGGIRSSSNKIPVPITKNFRLNKFGNIAGKRAKVKGGLEGLAAGKGQFIGKIGGATGVWKQGRKGQQPSLLIKFHDSVTYDKKPFDFYKIGNNYVRNTFDKKLDKEFKKAIRTAK